MIGAMPAVAVRHERRRAEKRGGGRRPSQLPLQRAPDDPPSPDRHRLRNELYVCSKIAALHAIVGSLLLGIVVLVVGLVQLSPGAEAAQHRYYLMGVGAALVGSGVVAAILRCICLHWLNRKFREEEEVEESEQTTHKNGVSVVESGHKHDHKGDHKHDHKTDKHDHKTDKHDHKTDKGDHKTDKGDHKADKGDHKSNHKGDHKNEKDHKTDHKNVSEKSQPKLRSQPSLGRDLDLVKQPSAASDT